MNSGGDMIRERLEDLLEGSPNALYLSVDLDVLDPAFAPGVSHHEPGGLSTRQVIDDCMHVVGNCIYWPRCAPGA